jgi:hypothetical protein
MTKIVGEVVLVMWTGTICHTHAIVEVLDRVTSQARSNDRTVTRLAILVTLKASASTLL